MRLALAASIFIVLTAAGCSEDGRTPTAEYRGDEKLPNGMTIKEAIEARQHNLKDLGGAFKMVNDQMAAPTPNMQEVSFAVQEVKNHAMDIDTWFHEGTGPSSGVKTEALARIWEDPSGFSAAAAAFEAAATKLSDAVAGGDPTAISAAAKETGATCKSCHETYRLKKD